MNKEKLLRDWILIVQSKIKSQQKEIKQITKWKKQGDILELSGK